MRHDYTELGDGESMILTLADKGILDESGNLVEEEDDELENVLKVGGRGVGGVLRCLEVVWGETCSRLWVELSEVGCVGVGTRGYAVGGGWA